eukprot:CCRYP_015926-RA/>CCRYP_015926-RA protein AED:0.23 eAED:-0.03 QI:0/0/0/1/1/1/2/0/125
MARKVRIGPDGNVIKDGDENGAAGGGGAGRRRFRLPSYVDVFGFHLEFKHFILLLMLVALTMGPVGAAVLGGKMAKPWDLTSREWETYQNHLRVDEVPTCVREKACINKFLLVGSKLSGKWGNKL